MGLFWLERARGLNTLTSKYVCCPSFPQKSSATMSKRTPSSRFATLWESRSSVTGCRCGSVPTPCQTSVSRWAVISLILLCLIEEKPPQWQLIPWSGEFVAAGAVKKVFWLPSITLAECILECTLVECEAMVLEG